MSVNHPAQNIAVWKLKRLLRRAEGLSFSDVQSLTKEELVQRSLNYTIISGNQENVFPTSLRIGNGTSNPFEHIHFLPTADIILRKKREAGCWC